MQRYLPATHKQKVPFVHQVFCTLNTHKYITLNIQYATFLEMKDNDVPLLIIRHCLSTRLSTSLARAAGLEVQLHLATVQVRFRVIVVV